MTITIITPAYNRAGTLTKLYESLKLQTNKDFEWLVIDDGSTDGTGELLKSFIDEQEKKSIAANSDTFPIEYCFQENAGKHVALNNGISKAKGELIFIVDSDDRLSENAARTILEFHEKYKDRKEELKLCGFSFLRAYSDGTVNEREFPVDEAVDTYRQQRINNNLLGDKAEVYYTDILKKYPFKVFENEKFMPEDAVWLKMSGPYNMVHANRIIYYCDYLEGGLTKSGRKMKIYSPYGMMYRSKVYIADPEVKIKVKIKMMLLYHIYSRFANIRDKESRNTAREISAKRDQVTIRKDALYYLCKIPAAVMALRWGIK